MKKIFLIMSFAFVALVAKNSFAQITIHEFPKSYEGSSSNGLGILRLTIGGDKICQYDSNTVKILNEDYTLYKTFNLPHFTGLKLSYIYFDDSSDKLWNLDDKIELITIWSTPNFPYTAMVINEDGVLVQSLKSEEGYVQKLNNKWIYTCETDSIFYVYDLPGSMPTSTKDKEIKILPSESNISVYPNPVNNEFTVFAPYTHIANIKIVGSDGKQIKSVNINDRNEKKINISAADMQSGTYIMQLTTQSGEKFIKKIVKQ